MQSAAKTPAEYIDRLEDDWRKAKLLELRELIRKLGPELDEGIRYKVLSYSGSKGGAFALAAQKNSVNFYVGSAKKVDTDGSLLRGLDVGKGCIRFNKTVAIADTRIAAFIAKAMAMWRQGEDIDC
jgi:uncharacterized protein YdhG (YjbR/CyaY superfamily)